MLCENCGENEASIKYTEIINGTKSEMMLCEKCSQRLGIDKIDLNLPIDFSSFFGGMLGEGNETEIFPLITKSKEINCDTCGMTYNEFIQNGKFGCSDCYNVFAEKIDSILKRIHGDNKYLGRRAKISENTNRRPIGSGPVSRPKEAKKENLQEELKLAIKEERYEDAAKIRDKIKRGE